MLSLRGANSARSDARTAGNDSFTAPSGADRSRRGRALARRRRSGVPDVHEVPRLQPSELGAFYLAALTPRIPRRPAASQLGEQVRDRDVVDHQVGDPVHLAAVDTPRGDDEPARDTV